MLSLDASGLVAQVRVLADPAQPLLAITDQLLSDVWVCGKHGGLLERVGWLGIARLCSMARLVASIQRMARRRTGAVAVVRP